VSNQGGLRAIAITLLLSGIMGCGVEPSDPPTVATWQQGLEKYVWDRGNGDPNVLADMSWDDVHKGFAVIGDPLPDRAIDQIGLLLAHRMLRGKPCFVFLLGTIRKQKLEALRPVALQVDGAAFRWILGNESAEALSLYRSWSDADRLRYGARHPAPPPFPRPQERFDVTVESDHVLILHVESGARWELTPSEPPATNPTAILRESGQVKS
jgi:hypothetical protein